MSSESETLNIIEMGWWINKKEKMFTRNHFTTYDKYKLIVCEHNCWGIYKTAYMYNTKDIEKAYLYGNMYFDFDSINDFEKAREDAMKTLAYIDVVFKIKPENVSIYFSGSKGIHILIPSTYFNVRPCKNLNQIFKYIATDVTKYISNKTLDLTIYDNKRLFRIPNTIHEKTGLYKIPLTYNELKSYSIEQIKDIAKQPRIVSRTRLLNNTCAVNSYKHILECFKEYSKTLNKNIQYKAKLTITPPCIKYLLEHGTTNGFRNNSIAILASFYKNRGLDIKRALTLIANWNNTLNVPPTSINELNRTVRSIYNSKASYGCSMIKTVSECDENNCKLKRRRKDG